MVDLRELGGLDGESKVGSQYTSLNSQILLCDGGALARCSSTALS